MWMLQDLGAGLLVTVSMAVYDVILRPPRLIRVVGVDTLFADLLEAGRNAGLNYKNVIEHLASRNKCPALKTDSSCLLNQVRLKGGAASCENVINSNCNDLSNVANCTSSFPDYCKYEPQRYKNNEYLFFTESCCDINVNTFNGELCTNKAPNLFRSSISILLIAL